MSRLKLSANLFLEVAELTRFNKFLKEDGYIRLIKAMVKSFGIVQTTGNSYFKVTSKPGTSNYVIINAGLAFDSNLEAIVMENDLELEVTNTGINRWIVLSRAVTNLERGTVSIDTDGSLVGVGTEFTKVLRGQPNFPTKVRFNSAINQGEYEVVSVINDQNAILSGAFSNQSGMKYAVVGTFTPGFQPLEDNKLIYEYDSYSIRIVDSEDKPNLSSNEFILAGISFDASGGMNVTDERIYSMFDNPYVQGGDVVGGSLNPLASLLSTGVVGIGETSIDFELIMEHGYTITKYELQTTSTGNTFNILAGSCNYLGTGNIPSNLFAGWLLLNRKNMKYAEIEGNDNKSLFIPVFDTSMIEDSNNDFVVIPNFSEIEFEVKVSNNVNRPAVPFYYKQSLVDIFDRMKLRLYYPDLQEAFEETVTISIQYRMINNSDAGKINTFSNLAIAQFINHNGEPETLSGSSFDVDIKAIQPVEKQRNYS